MAKYLNTQDISAGIVKLICEAREYLYLISPYLQLSACIKERIKDIESEMLKITFIFGKNGHPNSEKIEFLQKLKYAHIYYYKDLHAKCYLNEKEMIISSMNLYTLSQQNNVEMGVLIQKDGADKQVYDDARQDIRSILKNAKTKRQ
ncbi:hypothetical protein Barb4_03102 [Bacteroidales bacterium Barb4]|nr:hypothetical protein Barb4_03102 [Bacteroidales bacterium Barb4]